MHIEGAEPTVQANIELSWDLFLFSSLTLLSQHFQGRDLAQHYTICYSPKKTGGRIRNMNFFESI